MRTKRIRAAPPKCPISGMAGIAHEMGFSIIELLCVLLLMSILAASSIPLISTVLRNWQLNGDARSIAMTLTYAKLSSTSQLTHYQMLFDLGSNRWSIQKFNKNVGSFDIEGAATNLSNGIAHSGICFQAASGSAPSGFPTTSSAFIRFNSRGTPIDDAGIPTPNNIVYLSDGATNYAVTVSLAGRVQLQKFQAGQWIPQ
jgi:prepilin-type N-terminal cleavage/methylation domain-containing protein